MDPTISVLELENFESNVRICNEMYKINIQFRKADINLRCQHSFITSILEIYKLFGDIALTFLCFNWFTKTLGKFISFSIPQLISICETGMGTALNSSVHKALKLLQMKELCNQEGSLFLFLLSDSREVLSMNTIQFTIRHWKTLSTWQAVESVVLW